MDIVSWTLGNERYDQNKLILVDAERPDRSLSASQARTLIRQLVAGLRANGLQPGDYVCILSYSHIFYPILYLGIIGAGGCVTGCNPSHTTAELAPQLKTSGVKYIITESFLYQKAHGAAESCNIPPSNIFICDPIDQPLPPSYRSWIELLQHGESPWVTLTTQEAETSIAVLYSTSGTTGLPKSAMMSHAHCISVAAFIEASSRGKPYTLSRLVSLPLLHAFAAPIVHLSALREGIPTYLLPRFTPASFAAAVENFQISEIPVVPSMLVAAVSSPHFTPHALRSLRHIWTAGAPLSLAVQTSFRDLLHPEANIVPVYGMTECGWITSLSYPEGETSESVGRPVPGVALKLIDSSGDPIEMEGQLGELLVRPPHPTLGYVGNPIATAELFHSPGWVRSGDIAYARNGKYYIVDRIKDIIKVRSWQVSPAELENVLLQHPQVIDVAVIGVPDHGISGEVPHAFVVKAERSEELRLAELKAFMVERLARYKIIEGVSFVDSIPRNPAGKILRRVLREGFLEGGRNGIHSESGTPVDTPIATPPGDSGGFEILEAKGVGGLRDLEAGGSFVVVKAVECVE
ncbi:hypothetical protein MMC30_008096 [Trapelia coarctata]|nr:hypothetical protein [Trapelia coarctata]